MVAPTPRSCELAGALLEIAADPAAVATLYRVLRPFAHEFRNHLNSLNLARYLAGAGVRSESREPWRQVDVSYRALVKLIDQVQLISKPLQLAPIRCALDDLIHERRPAWTQWLADHDRQLELVAPTEPVYGFFDPARFTQALDALAAWRAEAGRAGSSVHLSWQGHDDELVLGWYEPGRAVRAFQQADSQPVALALPVVARVLAAHGGSLKTSSRGGIRICLRWPQDVSTIRQCE
jgi:hypothetical protein